MKNLHLRGSAYWRRVLVIPTAFAVAATVVVPVTVPQVTPQAIAQISGAGSGSSSGFAPGPTGTKVGEKTTFYSANAIYDQMIGDAWKIVFRNQDQGGQALRKQTEKMSMITLWPSSKAPVSVSSLQGSRIFVRDFGYSEKDQPVWGTQFVANADGSVTVKFPEQTGYYDLVLVVPKRANRDLVTEGWLSTDGKLNVSKVLVSAAPIAEKYNPIGTVQEVELNATNVDAHKSIGNWDEVDEVTDVYFKRTPVTSEAGNVPVVVVVRYTDGSTDEVNTSITVKDNREAAEIYTPEGLIQKVTVGDIVDAEKSIANRYDLPGDAKYAFTSTVDTRTAGTRDVTVVVTYADNSKDYVDTKVEVQAKPLISGDYDPQGRRVFIDYGQQIPDAKYFINGELPWNAKLEITSFLSNEYTLAAQPVYITVTYSDGSTDNVTAELVVRDTRKDAAKYEPKGQSITTVWGVLPDASKGIRNTYTLPEGTKYRFQTAPNVKLEGQQPVTIVVTYPDGSDATVDTTLTVNDNRTGEQKYEPTGRDITVGLNQTPDPKSGIANLSALPSTATYRFQTKPNTSKAGTQAAAIVVTYADGTTDTVNIKITVTDSRTDAQKYTPEAQGIVVNQGETPVAADGIKNAGDLPGGTSFEFETNPPTKVGTHPTTIVVRYPDKSTEKVTTTVTVKEVKDTRTDAQKYNPEAQGIVVNQGQRPDAADGIKNADALPGGTTFEFESTPPTKIGTHPTTIVVRYPDNSTDKVTTTVTVKEVKEDKPVEDTRTDADKFNPTGQAIVIDLGQKPNAADGIKDPNKLPSGTTFTFESTPPATTGTHPTTIVVTYPDGSKDKVTTTVTIEDNRKDAEKYDPQQNVIVIDLGQTPNPVDGIKNPETLPAGTTFTFETTPPTGTGTHTVVIVVSYPDGSTDKVTTTITIEDNRTDADKFDPTPQIIVINQGQTPNPADGIKNPETLPDGTTFEWETTIDVTTPGTKTGTIVVTYPDGSTETIVVSIVVESVDQSADSDNYEPEVTVITIGKGDELPDPSTVIVNIDDLPGGTTVDWKTEISTDQSGTQTGVIVVTYPDGSTDEATVTIEIERDDAERYTPEISIITIEQGGQLPDPATIISNIDDLPGDITVTWGTKPDTTTPGTNPGTIVVTYPDGSTQTVDVTVVVSSVPTVVEIESPSAPVAPGEKAIITPGGLDSGSLEIVEVTGPGTAVIVNGQIVVVPNDDAPEGAVIGVRITDGNGATGTVAVIVGPREVQQSEIVVESNNNGTVVIGGTYENIIIRDANGNDVTSNFQITERDGSTVITVEDKGTAGEFTVIVTDADGNESHVTIVLEGNGKGSGIADEAGITGADTTSSADVQQRCTAITAGVVGAPLLILIPIGLLSQVKIPGLARMNNALAQSIARMNDQLQRNMGIMNENLRRQALNMNSALGANNAALGQLGGAVTGIVALVALTAIGVTAYNACMVANGEESPLFKKEQ